MTATAAVATTGTPKLTAQRSVWARLLPFTGVLAVIVEIFVFAVNAPTFLSAGNLLNVVVQGSVVAVAAFGLTTVVIIGGDDVIRGGIDLSVGAAASLVGTIVAVGSVHRGIGTALLLGLAAAVAIGLANALSVALGIRPLLATLAVSSIASSVDLLVSNNSQTTLNDPFFVWMRDAKPLGIPVPVFVVAVVFAVIWFVLGFTKAGVRAYAVGGNPLAARVAGIRVNRYIIVSYVVSGLTAGVAGMLLIARLSSSSPGAGSSILLDVILASLMSLIFSRRLVVNVPGTLVGALFVAALSNGFTLINIPTYWVSGVKGVLILAVVAISALGNTQRK
ncbi:ABC transporter permease [Micromonospora sp. NPDC007271]|uniref:ABC transporter permease n=1 Tax=Micromonospora sp. NPDC007271 TaxID=3154587 RepID=UPI003411B1FB